MAIAITSEVLRQKDNIARACGLYRPFVEPDYHSILDGVASPFQYGSKEWLDHFNSSHLQSVFCHLAAAGDLTGNVGAWTLDPKCVHALRVTNYFLRTTWIPLSDASNPGSVINECGEFILLAMKAENNSSKEKKKMRELGTRLTRIIHEQHSRHKTLKSIYRWRFLSFYFTNCKTVVSKAINDLITERWKTGVEQIHRVVQPDVNYARRLATAELIVHRCTDMTTSQLLSFNDLLVRCYKVHPDLLMCSDNISLLTMVYKMGRARLNTKLVEVNPRHCRCFAKCVGPIGLEKTLEPRIWQSFERHAGILVCGLCRLAPLVHNTTVEKPRKTYSSITPEVESCSMDGSTSFKFVRLVVQDVRITSGGHVHVRYAHRFFTTNSVNVTDEVNLRPKRGTRARFYGMCYNGKRTCTKRFIVMFPSGSSEEGKNMLPFSNIAHWFRCKECQPLDKDHGALYSLGLNSHTSQSTCLRRFFTDVKFKKERLCRGCKIAATCAHLDITLYNRLSVDSLGLYRRISRLGELRHWLSTTSCWM